jgi:hypothetical protein
MAGRKRKVYIEATPIREASFPNPKKLRQYDAPNSTLLCQQNFNVLSSLALYCLGVERWRKTLEQVESFE